MTTPQATAGAPVDSALPAEMFPVVFVTGHSGAGKSTVLHVFEDMRFFTMDGLPATLVSEVTTVLNHESLSRFQGLVIGINLLLPEYIRAFQQALVNLRQKNSIPSVLFVEAKPSVLMQRYATTRRPHPLQGEGLGLEQAIEKERDDLAVFRDLADLVIDTSGYSIHDLRRIIQGKWQFLRENSHALKVHLISFGFKYGTPSEADMVFDLRFLPNPFFVPELKALSGLDAPIADFVLGKDPGASFFKQFSGFLQGLLPLYEAEGRYRLTIAIGCTGGRHRSVAATQALATVLKTHNYAISVEHRHLELG